MIRFRNLGVRLRDLRNVGMIHICVYIYVFVYVRLYIHNIRVLHSWNMPPRLMRFIYDIHTYTYVYIHVVYTKHLLYIQNICVCTYLAIIFNLEPLCAPL